MWSLENATVVSTISLMEEVTGIVVVNLTNNTTVIIVLQHNLFTDVFSYCRWDKKWLLVGDQSPPTRLPCFDQ